MTDDRIMELLLQITPILQPDTLRSFVRQSLAIEGIFREPTDAELKLHRDFAALPEITVADMSNAVRVLEPTARLRNVQDGGGVRVGRHRPEPNGPNVENALRFVLTLANRSTDAQGALLNSHEIYCRYESVHPFTDGNGRSGRLLWLWCVLRDPAWRGLLRPTKCFLEIFHYQTLDAHDSRKGS